MALVLGCLLLLGLCGKTMSAEPSSTSDRSKSLNFHFPEVNYETSGFSSPKPMAALFTMVDNFLSVVQPHEFPEDTVRKIVQKKFDPMEDYTEVVYYEIGLLFCAVLGLLFITLMPLVGCCFCMCRCCNHCGGEMHQRQKRNEPYLRRSFAISLLVICILISIGVIYGFVANHYLRTQIRQSRKLADSNFKDLRVFLNGTPAQMKYILSQYNTTKEKAFLDLDNIKSFLGEGIQNEVRRRVIAVLDDIKDMAVDISESKLALENMNSALEEMKNGIVVLNANLSTIKTNLEKSLNSSTCTEKWMTASCNSILKSLSQLDSNMSFNQLPAVDRELQNVNNVMKTDLLSLVEEGYIFLNHIPQMVENQSKSVVSQVKRVLDSFGVKISNITAQVPIQDTLKNFTVYVNNTETYVNHNLVTLEEYESYRWLGSLAVCCLLTLIVIFYYLGLLCGTCGYDTHATPTTRGCVSNAGGIFLMAGVGISFLFCWILMTIVVLTFVIGGNVEKLVCEPYENRKLFQILDTPYLLNEEWKYYLSGLLFQKPYISLTFEKVYSDCKANKGIYTSLQLENRFNISAHLHIQEYIKAIKDEFQHLNISLGNIVLLNSTGRSSLWDFSTSGIQQIDYAVYLAETNKTLTRVNLGSFADHLVAVAEGLPEGILKMSLYLYSQNVEALYHREVIPLEQSMHTLQQSIKILRHNTRGLMMKVNDIFLALNSAQSFIRQGVPDIIKTESAKYASVIIGHFKHYIQWVKHSITKKMAACSPVATALDSLVDAFLCSSIVDPLNLFWFGIGQATVFLLPAIIVAVKLAKYYRQMDSEEVYDE
ncbi:prominin-1 [Orycteropus afer afer]|uniref:Prominin-1 n=1 Tax=Orycteropus afer afer TaxID=1230840 RepID=A0AC54ZCJ9_ORYAF|nr:prominin-1 [Orycteropus afer afer]